MERYAIYEFIEGGFPVLRERFAEEEDALAYVKEQPSGEYGLFTKDEFGWNFLPVK